MLPRDSNNVTQIALESCEAASPLLAKERELITIINKIRREYHNGMRNKGKANPVFNTGDLVIVRKQVKSDQSRGVSAKLVFKTKGPYRVIEKVSEQSYKIQKLPILKGFGRKRVLRKESVARMTKIPSTMILHRTPEGSDAKFAQMNSQMRDFPLEK